MTVAMNISTKGLIELAGHEGIVLEPYKDSVGVWTIGVGHTKAAGPPDPKTSRKLELHEAIDLFKHDLKSYVRDVNQVVKIGINQHQFDALVSFHYNTGGIEEAALVQSLNAGHVDLAGEQFMNWRRPPSIIKRRKKEQRLFQHAVYSNRGEVPLYSATSDGRVKWSSRKNVNIVEHLAPELSKKLAKATMTVDDPTRGPLAAEVGFSDSQEQFIRRIIRQELEIVFPQLIK